MDRFPVVSWQFCPNLSLTISIFSATCEFFLFSQRFLSVPTHFELPSFIAILINHLNHGTGFCISYIWTKSSVFGQPLLHTQFSPFLGLNPPFYHTDSGPFCLWAPCVGFDLSPFFFLSPPMQFARWAHMRRFLSVCLSGWTRPKVRLENNSYLRKYTNYTV